MAYLQQTQAPERKDHQAHQDAWNPGLDLNLFYLSNALRESPEKEI